MSISTKLQQIAEEKMFPIDLASLYEKEDTFYNFLDKVNDDIFCLEIIYYTEAIKYLSTEDSSLSESLEIASEYCYEVSDLSSEVLATLLYQKRVTEQWYEIEEQVKELFNN